MGKIHLVCLLNSFVESINKKVNDILLKWELKIKGKLKVKLYKLQYHLIFKCNFSMFAYFVLQDSKYKRTKQPHVG